MTMTFIQPISMMLRVTRVMNHNSRESTNCEKVLGHNAFYSLLNSQLPEMVTFSSTKIQILLLFMTGLEPLYKCNSHSTYKNSSGDEIANVNFYAVRTEATRIF